MKSRNLASLAPGLVLLASCATQKPAPVPLNAVQCVDPRPQICTMDYNPVCATRCTTPSCESTAVATYANGCGACADPAVIYHQPAACEF